MDGVGAEQYRYRYRTKPSVLLCEGCLATAESAGKAATPCTVLHSNMHSHDCKVHNTRKQIAG